MENLEIILAAAFLGAILGAVFCYVLVKDRLKARYRLAFERWSTEAEKSIRARSLERSRAVLKGKIGEQMAPLLPGFGYEPADARFIGSPIDYIIFDGYSEAKDGRGAVRKIVLMDVKTGKAKLSPGEKKVREAVNARAVEWETLEI